MPDLDGGGMPQLGRTFAVPLRAVVAAVLHVHPRHVKLSSANAQTMRFTFDTPAGGFRVGEHLTAVLEMVAEGTTVTLVGGSPERRAQSEATMAAFLADVEQQLQREAGLPAEPDLRS